jgi:hypothetical protein
MLVIVMFHLHCDSLFVMCLHTDIMLYDCVTQKHFKKHAGVMCHMT